MKIPFTLDAWLKDKSQKVVDKDGRPVRIICTDADGLYPIIGLVDNKIPLPCGKDGRPPYIGGGGGTLFIVTPEEELTAFEGKVKELIGTYPVATRENHGSLIYEVRKIASELLTLAEKEIAKGHEHDVYIPEDTYYEQLKKQWEEGYDKGKAEALKDLPRWRRIMDNGKVDANGCRYTDSLCLIKQGWYRVLPEGTVVSGDAKYLSVSELEKLPGFKED